MGTGKWVLAFVLLATPAAAQITPVYTFTAGTIISPDEMNTNFALLQNALNRTGGTMTGTLNARLILPVTNDTFDLGSSALRFRNQWLSGNLTVTGGITAATLTGNLVGGASSLTCTGCVNSVELASTTVAPAAYGSPTAFGAFTVDADGRLTAASNVTPQLTLTSTYFSSLSGAALTNIPAAQITGALPPAALPANAATLNAASNTFTGAMVYSTTSVMSWQARTTGTVYQAATDGFVLVNMTETSGTSIIEIRSDGSNPPTTVRAKATVLNTTQPFVSFMSPVRKGDFYSATVTMNTQGTLAANVTWIPLGTGG